MKMFLVVGPDEMDKRTLLVRALDALDNRPGAPRIQVLECTPVDATVEWKTGPAEFWGLVADELARARSIHTLPMHSLHEAIAVIHEEFEELRTEVYKRRHGRPEIVRELVQLAAVCQRMFEDLRLGGPLG